ncbi:hypothetical protein ACFTAO_25940 [Paenibacillus rhizoplanae]
MNDRPLSDGIIPAEFREEPSLTVEEVELLKRLPILGGGSNKAEELVRLFRASRIVDGLVPLFFRSSNAGWPFI